MLVEVLFALAIALLVSFGLIRSIIYSVNNSNFAKDQSQATNLANRKMAEYIDGWNHGVGFFDSIVSPLETLDTSGRFCLKTTHNDVSGDLPSQIPNWKSEKMMIKIGVDVFWGEIGMGTQCDSKNYSHSQHFETYVTN